MSGIEALTRWMHIFFGILWIGHLYFFNFVNASFAATLDADSKRKVVPELIPRALYWFRWGALWTWVTGVLLLMMVFYHGGLVFDGEPNWSLPVIVMIALTFALPFVYDALAKSALVQKKQVFVTVSYLLIAAFVLMASHWAGFGYRGYTIHMGALFGTIMAFNVWFRIWPAQQKIITAVKSGQAPDAGLVALAGLRSRHNTYLSVPLVWTMINSHTTFFAGGNWGMTTECAQFCLLAFVALGWHVAWICYRRAGKVKGF